MNDYIDLPILPLQSIDNLPRTARALWTWGTCLTEATRDRLLAAYPDAICYDLHEISQVRECLNPNPDMQAELLTRYGHSCILRGEAPARFLIVNLKVANVLG